MLIGVGDKIMTTQNDKLPYRLPDILQLSYSNFGSNIWLLDTRRYKGSYRTAPPTLPHILNSFGSVPVDVTGVSTFVLSSDVGSPANQYLSVVDGYPVIQYTTDIQKYNILTSTVNTTNGATSLSAVYRIKLTSINTINNVGYVTEILNNPGNAHRFGIAFTNYSGSLDLGVMISNQDVAGEYFTATGTNLNNLYNKWVTIIVDINYTTRVLRMWLNGILVINTTVTGITAGALPSTNSAFSVVLGSTFGFWVGYCSYARMWKNGTITDDDAKKLHSNIEFSTLAN